MGYNNELELIFYKLDGLKFQDFFNDLMSFSEPEFKAVKQIRDGGNDGFIESKGHLYQVFSPEGINSESISKGASKIINDFEKVLKNWSKTIKLERYIFVYNDKLKGADLSPRLEPIPR
eukprot:TRINITY_DN6968_c0_g1_i1.p1 TRINITY_DN6968_c0_g1~~TRINITY_DN6968_c0_g1_i1.p1  ORF type:complete len:119 (-),score=12.63 TRINITY_DN6968_c0_g1_i1:24-380(-)